MKTVIKTLVTCSFFFILAHSCATTSVQPLPEVLPPLSSFRSQAAQQLRLVSSNAEEGVWRDSSRMVTVRTRWEDLAGPDGLPLNQSSGQNARVVCLLLEKDDWLGALAEGLDLRAMTPEGPAFLETEGMMRLEMFTSENQPVSIRPGRSVDVAWAHTGEKDISVWKREGAVWVPYPSRVMGPDDERLLGFNTLRKEPQDRVITKYPVSQTGTGARKIEPFSVERRATRESEVSAAIWVLGIKLPSFGLWLNLDKEIQLPLLLEGIVQPGDVLAKDQWGGTYDGVLLLRFPREQTSYTYPDGRTVQFDSLPRLLSFYFFNSKDSQLQAAVVLEYSFLQVFQGQIQVSEWRRVDVGGMPVWKQGLTRQQLSKWFME